MTQLSDARVAEYIALQDMADALELTLPSDPSKNPDTALNYLRNQLGELGEIEVGGPDHPEHAERLLGGIHNLAEMMIKASAHWPKGDLTNATVMERREEKRECTDTLKRQLAAFDAHRYMALINTLMRNDGNAFKADARNSVFLGPRGLNDRTRQETLGFLKWQLSDLTAGEVTAPGPRDVFDPAHVTIKRHWSSPTELTTQIGYDGEDFGEFQDEGALHALGYYVPKMTEIDAIQKARDVFYDGMPGLNYQPVNASSVDDMAQQVRKDLVVAQQSESVAHNDRHILSSFPVRIERLCSQENTNDKPPMDDPSLSM